MKLSYFPIVLLSLFLSVSKAQTSTDNVLFTIDNEPVYTSEFIRVYNKNIDLVQDESQKDVDEYLNLFTNYKLKLKEANSIGLQNKESYIRELDSYKKQLAKSFMTDTKVTDVLIEESPKDTKRKSLFKLSIYNFVCFIDTVYVFSSNPDNIPHYILLFLIAVTTS